VLLPLLAVVLQEYNAADADAAAAAELVVVAVAAVLVVAVLAALEFGVVVPPALVVAVVA